MPCSADLISSCFVLASLPAWEHTSANPASRPQAFFLGTFPGDTILKKNLTCPLCKGQFSVYANPLPTADILVYEPSLGVVIIERKNPPLGFALPGGFVDEGEWIEHAALREAMEETSLEVVLTGILGVYSRPDRDPRCHTLTTVFTARAIAPSALRASDDAKSAFWADPAQPPAPMCFDHGRMLQDFADHLAGKRPIGALSSEWLATPEGRENLARLELLNAKA